jgi:hypothetical protein
MKLKLIESTTTSAVAGSDSRYGGASFEGLHFEEPTIYNDAFRNELRFHKDSNVKPEGFEYVKDKDIKGMEEPAEDSNDAIKDAIKDPKMAYNPKLDMENRSYKKLLQKLAKTHNI